MVFLGAGARFAGAGLAGATGAFAGVLGATGAFAGVLGATGAFTGALGATGAFTGVLGATGALVGALGVTGALVGALGVTGALTFGAAGPAFAGALVGVLPIPMPGRCGVVFRAGIPRGTPGRALGTTGRVPGAPAGRRGSGRAPIKSKAAIRNRFESELSIFNPH